MSTVKPRRVKANDLQKAGGLAPFVTSLIKSVESGKDMDARATSAMLLHALTEQASLDDDVKGSKDKRENSSFILESGAIEPLVSLVASGSSSGQLYALSTLSNLANGRAETQKRIFDAGGVPKIAACLRGGDAPTQAAAAAAMASVSQLAETRVAWVKANTIPTLVSLLTPNHSVQLQVHAVESLANISRDNHDGQVAMMRAGAVKLLIALLDGGKSQEAAALCLQRLAEHSSTNRDEITELGGARKLIALLGVVNVDVQAHAAGALAALASGEGRTEQQDLIAKTGGIRPLLALVEGTKVQPQVEGTKALAMLARNNPENQEAIVACASYTPSQSLPQAPVHHPACTTPKPRPYPTECLTRVCVARVVQVRRAHPPAAHYRP